MMSERRGVQLSMITLSIEEIVPSDDIYRLIDEVVRLILSRVQVNIFERIADRHHANDCSTEYNDALRKRQIWCEGTFVAQKARHNLRQMFQAGLAGRRRPLYPIGVRREP